MGKKKMSTTHRGWRPKRCCLVFSGVTALLLACLCTVVALRGKMRIPGTPASTGGDSVSSASDTAADSLTGDADCVVDPSVKDPYHKWNIQQHEWCCWNYRLGCHLLFDRMRKRAQQRAAQVAAQVPRNESLFANSTSNLSNSRNNSSSSSNTNSSTHDAPQELPSESNASDSGSAQEMLPAGNTSPSTSVQKTLPGNDPRNRVAQDVTTAEASTTAAPEYNCDQDRGSWKTAWSHVKQAWCCSRHNVGCSTVAR